MPYVNSRGEVTDGIQFSIYKFFIELYFGFIMFFKTLLAPLIGSSTSDPDAASRYRDSLRGRGGGGGGGGGGSGGGGGWFGGGGGGGGGDGGRRRPIGRLNNTSMSMPSCASGGCCG